MGSTLVVAGLWVRPLAEAARQAGCRVIALDLFGDADTRRASERWARIGEPSSYAIDPALLRDELRHAAREPGVIGWVAASGFEAVPEALDIRIPGLPLLGMSSAAVRRVRDPASFFPTLDRLGLPHPEVALEPPRAPQGWLVKSAAACGGWHIRRAGQDDRADRAGIYWQRLQGGEPMSALFVADGARARLVALNRLVIRPLGDHPFVYHGALGPIADYALEAFADDALARLVPAFGLRGLGSLDFLAQDGRAWLLEVNARPSATMVLHERAWPGGLMHAHLRGVQGELPSQPAAHPPGVRGCLIVFAERACRVRLALAAQMSLAPDCHDLPAPGASFGADEPVCSVDAQAPTADAVMQALEARAADIRSQLEAWEESTA